MKVLLADDHTMFREGLKSLLMDFNGEDEFFEAENFGEAATITQEEDVDLILLDLQMPGGPWQKAVHSFKDDHPSLRIVVLSASENHADILEALQIGAVGFISKKSSGTVLQNALRLVLSGETYVPPMLLSTSASNSGPGMVMTGTGAAHLTKRQMEVLAELRKGAPNKVIAHNLNLAEGTVKLHITALLKALGARNRTQAVVKAEELRI